MIRKHQPATVIRTRTILLALIALACASTALAAVPEPAEPTDYQSLQKMRLGQVNVADNKKYNTALEDLAKWLAHRLAQAPFNGMEVTKKQKGPVESIDTLLAEVETWCTLPKTATPENFINQAAYGKEFAKKMEFELFYMMNEPKKIIKVNAARMFVIIGKLPHDGLADAYLKMIQDQAFPAEVKLFAFQGLKNLLNVPDPADTSRPLVNNPDKLKEICTLLDTVITMTYPLPSANPEEAARVIQFIRREAIRCLSAVRWAVVRNRQSGVVAKPILTLLRVASVNPAVRKSFTPPFTESEQIEAVIGICSMRPDATLNLDAVAWLVNESLRDMGTWLDKDRAAYENDNRDKPRIPWKLTAYRLTEAMKLWKDSSGKAPAKNGKVVSDYVEIAIDNVLTKIEDNGVNARPDFRKLETYRTTKKPSVAQIFSDDPMTAFPVQ